VALVAAIAVFLGWFLMDVFEGEQPKVTLAPLPGYIKGETDFRLDAADAKRGLKRVLVTASQEDRTFKVIEREFPFEGLANRHGTHNADVSFKMNPALMHLGEGPVKITVEVSDFSRRNGGDGNTAVVVHETVVDTTPPSIRPASRLHYINEGGTGLVVYRQSSDAQKSGVYVGDAFFPGYPAGEGYEPDSMVCYFAVPCREDHKVDVYLHAEDQAGNSARNSFNHSIRWKKFPVKTITVSERFLESVLPDFAYVDFSGSDRPIDKFLKINRELRVQNNETCRRIGAKSSREKLWDGEFARMKNAATMAGFGDERVYTYHGKEIDRQTHQGVDLASVANAEIRAANRGKVVYADRLGIYGLTVILDHGQGISSLYAHLSSLGTEVGRDVERGERIGVSGQTGLAGGDHLHFSVMINGVFVNPIEFWDGHWINDNIQRKLSLIQSGRS
jgi:murein DD-endopeptidase MepM/ murein hydrolase activator NlpD